MIGTSVHQERRAETVERPGRPRALCAGCGGPSGSVSRGTGYPLMGKKGGPMYHVGCEPGDVGASAMLERLGA